MRVGIDNVRRSCALIACVVAVASLSSRGWGQDAEPRYFVAGGVTFSRLTIDEPRELVYFDPTTGLNISIPASQAARSGAIAEAGARVPLHDLFALHARVSFSMRGNKLRGTGVSAFRDIPLDLEVTTKINLISLVLLGRVQRPTGMVQPYAAVGPELGVRVSASATTEVVYHSSPVSSPEPVDTDLEGVNRAGVGILFVGGIDIPTGRTRIFLEAQLARGMTNLFRGSEEHGERDRSLAVTLGWAF